VKKKWLTDTAPPVPPIVLLLLQNRR